MFNYFSFVGDSLSFIRRYSGSIFVIKYGGSAMIDLDIQSKVIEDICFLHSLGIKIVLVHGGGPFINDWLYKLNIVPKFENGIRVTDSKTMEVVQMVLVGQVNKCLISLFNKHNVLSVGLSGKDANLVVASSLFQSSDNFVGKVDYINPQILNILLNNNYIPVISSIGSDGFDKTYNINADTLAGSIAESLNANKLILLTDTLGVMENINDSSTLIKKLSIKDVDFLKKSNIISGGMIPKVECCVKALKSNVDSAHIISGSVPRSLLYETLTSNRVGSMITL